MNEGPNAAANSLLTYQLSDTDYKEGITKMAEQEIEPENGQGKIHSSMDEHKLIPYRVLVDAYALETDPRHTSFSNSFFTSLELVRSISLARNLNHTLARNLALDRIHALDRRSARPLYNDIARALDHARDLAHDLDRGLDRDRALDLARDDNNAFDLDLPRVLDITREVKNTLDLARHLDRDLDRRLDFTRALAHAHDSALTVAQLLEEFLDRELDITSVKLKTDDGSLYGGPTPDYLGGTITPYVRAVAQIQGVIDRLTGQEGGEVRIAAMTRGSLDISFDGAARAIEVLLDTIVPWRRENAKTIAKLNEQEKQATVLKIQAEAEAESENAAAKAREEVRKLQLENEKLQVELHEKRIDLALKVIDKLNPELPQAQKIGYVIQLLEPIKVITESPLQLVDSSGDGSEGE